MKQYNYKYRIKVTKMGEYIPQVLITKQYLIDQKIVHFVPDEYSERWTNIDGFNSRYLNTLEEYGRDIIEKHKKWCNSEEHYIEVQ